MENEMSEQEMKDFHRAMQDYSEYQNKIADANEKLVASLGIPSQDIHNILDYADIRGAFTVTNTPKGICQSESHGIFLETFVDQWSVGDSGDSFEGNIYGKLDDDKWLKIPFSC